MRAGSLREVVEIQEVTIDQDAHGQPRETWTTIDTRFVNIREDQDRKITITMRYYAGLLPSAGEFKKADGTLLKNHRFLHKNRILNIEDVLNLESREKTHRVHCVVDDERFILPETA